MTARLALIALLIAGCSHAPPGAHPLEGRIWDLRAGRFVSPEELFARASAASHVILGETHDNPEHHRLQRRVMEELSGPRSLAMEQFDSEHQAAIDAAQAKNADAEAIADAGRFDRKGWNWPLYRPLVELAVERRWPVVAANLSRPEARRIVREPALSGLAPDPVIAAALERDIAENHCGQRPEPKLLAGMVEAQRARDARMASLLKAPSVLITGSGHARRDRGVPAYLPGADIVSIGFTEIDPEKTSPQDYLAGFYTPASFDYLWFTPRASREDPCARPPFTPSSDRPAGQPRPSARTPAG
jgi:uncharacterized iron-regulated protein